MSTNISAKLPKELTSYDFLKALALILMIIDHVGLYFYPDELWFRIVGRLSVPIWFFLIGYARTNEISKSLWIGGFIVLLSAFMSGQYLLPLNILFMLAAARYLREGLVFRALHSPETLRGMFLILAFASIPTGVVLEYGSLGLLFVVMGYMMRHWQDTAARIAPKYLVLYIFMAFTAFWLLQGAMAPQISVQQVGILTLGLLCVGFLLFWFKPQVYPRLTKILTMPVAALIKLMGRWTLEIYVCHIVIFRVVCTYLYPERFPFMELKIIAQNIIAPMM